MAFVEVQCVKRGDNFRQELKLFFERFALSDVTDLLTRIEAGDGHAADELLPLVYDELRCLAAQRLAREAPGNTLQATELVHEAYLRLVGADQQWESNSHFFAAAAEAMRRILVDRARAKKSLKRGGGRRRIEIHDSAIKATQAGSAEEEILLVNDLLDRLTEIHPNEAELAKLRYFADFSVSEAARALGIPVSTAHDRWSFAQAWLRCEFEKG
jgi:RNA polymerase sigma factor (TIGR02999 family)